MYKCVETGEAPMRQESFFKKLKRKILQATATEKQKTI
jgi:hypothetical protein